MTFLRIKRRVPSNRDVRADKYNVTFQNGCYVVRLWLQPITSFPRRQDAEAECKNLASRDLALHRAP